PALSGRLAHAVLRLRKGRDRCGAAERHARPRDRPEARVGACQPPRLPGRRQPRPARDAASNSRHRLEGCEAYPRHQALPKAQIGSRRPPVRVDRQGKTIHHRRRLEPRRVDRRAEPAPAPCAPTQAAVVILMVSYSVTLAGETDFAGWRDAARRLALNDVPPQDVVWQTQASADLFGAGGVPLPEVPDGKILNVPREFVDSAEGVICHRDPARFALLYRLLWRMRDEPHLLKIASDPDVAV